MTWLTGWKHRVYAPVPQNTGAAASFQVQCTVHYGVGRNRENHVYCNSLCNTDFSDIRFTQSDGSTLESYCQQSKTDSDNAVYWVKVTGNISSADVPLYVYFGNPNAASLSSETNTFVDVISGVVGAWPLEEVAGGNATDYSGNSLTGTASGTTAVAGPFAGKKARSFVSTSSDVISISDNAVLDLTTNLSIIFYFKAVSGQIPCVEKASAYFAYYGNTGQTAFGRCYSDAAADVNKAFTADNNWHILIYTYTKGGNQTVRVDNGADGTEAVTASIDTNNNALKIGYLLSANRTGSIGLVTIFNTALSASNKTNLYGTYPDPTIDAGKVCVRKYSTSTTQPYFMFTVQEDLLTPAVDSANPNERARKYQKLVAKQRKRQIIQLIVAFLENKTKVAA